VSHELRTPLNVILGRGQMLRAFAADPEMVHRAAETIQRNAEALARLVDDLLDVSRITLGQFQMELKAVQLSELVESAALGLQPAAQAKGVRLTIGAPSQLPRVTGDPTRLQQVVWNLLSNAVKFTPPGGEIDVSLRRDGAYLLLIVSDTGEGIDPAFLPHVFEMFRQGDSTNTRTRGGLGLGLSIVRRLVELHGGMVSAHSAGAGFGSTFTVSLPHRHTTSVVTSTAPEEQPA
jgi:signal transduction histidine kinase